MVCCLSNWTNAVILLIGPLGINLSEIFIKIYTFSFKRMHLKMLSGNWRPFCIGVNVLIMCELGDHCCYLANWTLGNNRQIYQCIMFLFKKCILKFWLQCSWILFWLWCVKTHFSWNKSITDFWRNIISSQISIHFFAEKFKKVVLSKSCD